MQIYYVRSCFSKWQPFEIECISIASGHAFHNRPALNSFNAASSTRSASTEVVGWNLYKVHLTQHGIGCLLCICFIKDANTWKPPERTRRKSESTVLLEISLAIKQQGGFRNNYDLRTVRRRDCPRGPRGTLECFHHLQVVVRVGL
jgi:hypothetical protein